LKFEDSAPGFAENLSDCKRALLLKTYSTMILETFWGKNGIFNTFFHGQSSLFKFLDKSQKTSLTK
jgi:hypothetical protein